MNSISRNEFPKTTLHLFTIVSFLIHLFFFSIAFFVLKGKNHPVLPSTYMVNLISPKPIINSSGPGTKALEPERPKVEKADKAQTPKIPEKRDSKKSDDDQLISERIAAIMAKKRIEKIAGLRKTISLQAGAAGKKGIDRGSGGKKEAIGGIPSADDYYSRITSEIWQHWVYPDSGRKEIEAVIVIKILKDGSVQIKGIEKSSGNSLFDRSAIRAITKASPLTPPPYEMEIGVRFYP